MDSQAESARTTGYGHLIIDKPSSIVVSGVGKDAEHCQTVQTVPGVSEAWVSDSLRGIQDSRIIGARSAGIKRWMSKTWEYCHGQTS
jgi:hypothetical protein